MFVEVHFSEEVKRHMYQMTYMPEDLTGSVFTGLNDANPAKAVEQLDRHYQHGGGWRAFKGFNLHGDIAAGTARLRYPGDPPLRLIAWAKLRDETIALFESSWVCVQQASGDIEVARMD